MAVTRQFRHHAKTEERFLQWHGVRHLKPDQAGVQISVGRTGTKLPNGLVLKSWFNPKNWRFLVEIQSTQPIGVKTVPSVNGEIVYRGIEDSHATPDKSVFARVRRARRCNR
jgi:hypothetical protein